MFGYRYIIINLRSIKYLLIRVQIVLPYFVGAGHRVCIPVMDADTQAAFIKIDKGYFNNRTITIYL